MNGDGKSKSFACPALGLCDGLQPQTKAVANAIDKVTMAAPQIRTWAMESFFAAAASFEVIPHFNLADRSALWAVILSS